MKHQLASIARSTCLAAMIALSGSALTGCGESDSTGVLAPVNGQIEHPEITREVGGATSAIDLEKLAAKLVKKLLRGGQGGEVANGKYKVKFAPGAFAGEKLITVTTLGLPSGAVLLGPHGLDFDAQVTLSIDLQGTAWDSPAATIEWWDPEALVWVDMHGAYDPATRTVTATLPHFSTYRPRAGW